MLIRWNAVGRCSLARDHVSIRGKPRLPSAKNSESTKSINVTQHLRAISSTMADKEATVYIVDLGKSMARKHHGRSESDLDWAMIYIWEKITSTAGAKLRSECLQLI